MMYILNDYSIDNQFNDIETFLDSLIEHTIPLLKTMDKYNLDLLKGYEVFNLKVAVDLSIFEILNLRGYPEITRFKSLLNKRLYDNPYWESEGLGHDCIVEAFKRNVGLVSLEHKAYLKDNIEFTFEEKLKVIPNNYNKNQLLELLSQTDSITVGEYLVVKFPIIQRFCDLDGRDYFEEFIKENDIKQDEVNKILKDLNDFMNRYLNKQPLGRLSDTIESNLYEFRTSISDSKEVRILYCLDGAQFLFLNCFIKKQQKTPEKEKQLGRKLRDIMIS